MNYGEGQFLERRRSTRIGIRVPINMTLLDDPLVISGKTQDISLGGMKVKAEISPSPFKVNDELSFAVKRDYFTCQGRGKIMWFSPMGDSFGIQFVQLDETSRRSLKELLSLIIDVPPNYS